MSFSRLIVDTTSYSLKSNRRFYRKSRKDALPVSIAILLSVTVSLLAFSKLQSLVPIPNSLSALSLPITSRVSTKYPKGFCDGDPKYFTNNRFSLFLLLPGVLFSFVGLAIVTDDYFVPSLESICDRLHLSEDVAGATFMAAGSSAPELFTSLLGVFVTEDDVGIGTIVGSAVFNILVIIGLSGALAGATLSLDWRPLMRDSAFYFLSIVLLLLFVLPITKARADWWEGLILVAVYLGYILFMKFGNKPYMKHTEKFVRDLPPTDPLSQAESAYSNLTPRAAFRAAGNAVIAMNRLRSNSSASGDIPSIDANRSSQISAPESQRRSFLGVEFPKTRMQKIAFPFTFPWRLIFHWTVPNCTREGWKKWWPVTFSNSIIWIMGISYIMVEAARLSGCLIGIPAPVMGLTVLAAGTSVPDALASVAVARAGRGNMAVSNAIGSNVFDILLGLGLPWFLGGVIKRHPIPVQVDPIGVVVIPIAILFAILFILIVIFLLLRWKLSRPLGFILFGLYGVFVIYQLLEVFVLKIGEKK